MEALLSPEKGTVDSPAKTGQFEDNRVEYSPGPRAGDRCRSSLKSVEPRIT